MGKIVFYLNRYLVPLELILDLSGALASNPSRNFCIFWYLLEEFGSVFSLAVVEVILMTQAWVLYGGEKRMQIVMWTLLGLCLATSFILIGIGSQEVVVGASLNPLIPGCVAILTARVQFWEFWTPWMFLSLVIFTLTVARAHAAAKGDVTTPLGEAMIRDGIYYFGIIAVASIINVAIFAAAPVSLQSFGIPWFQAIASISGSRLLLNMRKVRADTQTHYTPVTPRRVPYSFASHRRMSSSQRPLFLGSPSTMAHTDIESPDISPYPEGVQLYRRISLD